jgi:hypothetical protein
LFGGRPRVRLGAGRKKDLHDVRAAVLCRRLERGLISVLRVKIGAMREQQRRDVVPAEHCG